jgi:DNA-binding MarR family transcriptional regulator
MHSDLIKDQQTMSRSQSLDEVLTYRISMLELLLSRAVGAVYSDHFGLNTHEWRVLAAVSVWGPIEAIQVSRWATVDKAAVSRAVRGLMSKHLIERSLHDSDGRKIMLELTPDGRRTVKAVVQRIGVIQEHLFKGYNQRKMREFFTMLRTIESRLREMQEVPARRREERLNAERSPSASA